VLGVDSASKAAAACVVKCVHCAVKITAYRMRIRELKRVTNSAKMHKIRPFKSK